MTPSLVLLSVYTPELVVGVDVPGGDTHQLVEVGGGGGHDVHARAVDVHLVQDTLPRHLGPQEAPTLKRELTSVVPKDGKWNYYKSVWVGG